MVMTVIRGFICWLSFRSNVSTVRRGRSVASPLATGWPPRVRSSDFVRRFGSHLMRCTHTPADQFQLATKFDKLSQQRYGSHHWLESANHSRLMRVPLGKALQTLLANKQPE